MNRLTGIISIDTKQAFDVEFVLCKLLILKDLVPKGETNAADLVSSSTSSSSAQPIVSP